MRELETNSDSDSKDNSYVIDAVITWVDGDDPKHKAKLDAYLRLNGIEKPRAAAPSRFHDANEIEYCVVSLLRFAPWIRRIYIITDDQSPRFMQSVKLSELSDKIHVVDHKVIFQSFEECLPTFNIRTIMTVMWRIPDVSENFIFLNDDFVLLRPIGPELFFRENKLVLRGQWVRFSELRWSSRVREFFRKILGRTVKQEQQRVKHLAAQELSAKLAGFTEKYYQLPHNPHPFRCSLMRDFQINNRDAFEENLMHRFRSPRQFISECLMAHLAIASGSAILDNRVKTVQLKPAEQSYKRTLGKMQQADQSTCYAFGCIQNLTEAPENIKSKLIEWLNIRIGSFDQYLRSQSLAKNPDKRLS